MKVVHCSNCASEFNHDIAVARVAGLVLGVLAGKQSAAQAALGATAGLVIGHIVDDILVEYIDPKCPECGLVIREAAKVIA